MVISEERKNILDQLFQAFSIAAEGTYVYICDMSFNYSRWSKNAVDYFGLPGEYMVDAGKIWEEHIHPDDRKTFMESIDAIFSGRDSGHDMQYRARDRNGHYVVCTCRGTCLVRTDGTLDYFLGVIRNHGIFGHINALTGLRNQYGFFEDLKIQIQKENPFNILMFGITHFAAINSVYGYEFGDLVVQSFARRFLEGLGNRGALYRLDGVRFAIVSYTMSMEEIESEYARERAHLFEGLLVDGKRLPLEMCAGAMRVDTFPISDMIVYACLSYAFDRSKERAGGEIQVFDKGGMSGELDKTEVLSVIRDSVIRGCEGFKLFYQPIMDAESEHLKGAEALIRWGNDKFGMVPPDSFIPIMENDVIFLELGEWVLRTAMTDGKRFLEKEPGFILNVNLSYIQIKRGDFPQTVKKILKETGYPPRNLCLELTERCRFLDIDQLRMVFQELQSMGIRMALDDFGTGFASISMVQLLPFDTIKIDRTFVKEIDQDPREKEVLRDFVEIASLYGSDVCVEGIENPYIRDLVKESPVNSLQGFYYSRPVPLPEFMEEFL